MGKYYFVNPSSDDTERQFMQEEPTIDTLNQTNNISSMEMLQSPATNTPPTAQSSTKKVPKKRDEKWQRNIAKKARLEGNSYESPVAKKNKKVEARTLKPACSCRAKCFEKLSEEVRQTIFENFWSGCKSWEQRRQYVADRVTKTVKVRTKKASRRKYNFIYNFQVNDKTINVCRVMFLNTLSIGEKYVKICVSKKNESGMTEHDKRGRHVPANKTKDSIVQSVLDHISSYPSYGLNLSTMYKQYKEKMVGAGKSESEYAKEWFYRKISNLKIH